MLNSFTYDEYKYILTQLISKYDLIDFQEAYNRANSNSGFFATIRHDVDLDLTSALKMAEIENELSIVSTYFFLVSSNAYNIFSANNKKILNSIITLGHNVGLHYNPLCYGTIAESESLQSEVILLESILSESIKVISWHKPSSLPAVTDVKSNYFDTTRPPFFNAQMKYFADSRCKWSQGHPLESPEFKMGHPMHICFHPIWWSDVRESRLDKLSKFVTKNNKRLTDFVDKEILP